MFQHLSSKKIVVIGASSGIGLAVSRKTAQLGAYVVMSSRPRDKLNQAIASIIASKFSPKTVPHTVENCCKSWVLTPLNWHTRRQR